MKNEIILLLSLVLLTPSSIDGSEASLSGSARYHDAEGREGDIHDFSFEDTKSNRLDELRWSATLPEEEDLLRKESSFKDQPPLESINAGESFSGTNAHHRQHTLWRAPHERINKRNLRRFKDIVNFHGTVSNIREKTKSAVDDLHDTIVDGLTDVVDSLSDAAKENGYQNLATIQLALENVESTDDLEKLRTTLASLENWQDVEEYASFASASTIFPCSEQFSTIPDMDDLNALVQSIQMGELPLLPCVPPEVVVLGLVGAGLLGAGVVGVGIAGGGVVMGGIVAGNVITSPEKDPEILDPQNLNPGNIVTNIAQNRDEKGDKRGKKRRKKRRRRLGSPQKLKQRRTKKGSRGHKTATTVQ